ncbi:hypothetical protein [Gimesia chilikensis]|jgi:hypothetical protein|uniref:hypothetical protein n=1 Tax=Gimesia chilikensis TaxID=2605989 RepID=UPI00118BDA43|nr:hypothetical protein [Gimesia chilikensis]QDT84378.1 hypothetical protein MalM14_20320 [Gimesia chilikensis]
MTYWEDKLQEYSFLWEEEQWVILARYDPEAQRMRSLIFNTETEEALLIEDNELAEFLESEMIRRDCRVLDPDELGWNEENAIELS